MTRALCNTLVSFVLIVGATAINFPIAAETTSPTKDAAGQKAGDACIAGNGGTKCCNGQTTCVKMVECDVALNQCKQEKMKTDTKCSTPDCAKCTSTYKTCHDNAVNSIQPVTIECTTDKDHKRLTLVGTNPNPFPETCDVTCTFLTGDKQQVSEHRVPVNLPKQAVKASLDDNANPGKPPITNLVTKAVCK
jgi:hypothetical protein